MSSGERNPRRTEAEMRAHLLRQYGLISTAQARKAGMSAAGISRRVEAGRWLHVHHGVYRDALVPETLEQAAFAALLWAGPDAVASHATAGALWVFDGVSGDRVHLWVPRCLKSNVVVVHRGEVDVNDRRMLGPITLTSPARTLIDLAGSLDDEDLNAVLEDAIHRGLTTAPAVGRRLDALGGKGRAGSARLREILDDRGNQRPTASRLEVKTGAPCARTV